MCVYGKKRFGVVGGGWWVGAVGGFFGGGGANFLRVEIIESERSEDQ